MDRAPSEQHRGCRGIQAGGSPLLPRYGLQARWSTLDPAGPAREDGRDSHTQGLCDPARPALDPGRSREFSGIRKSHCNFRTGRCPNPSEAGPETAGSREVRGHHVDPAPQLASGKAGELPRPGGTPGGGEVQRESLK